MTKTSRIAAAIIETETALARAMRYSPDLRDAALIAVYEQHIINLRGMLAGTHPLPGEAA